MASLYVESASIVELKNEAQRVAERRGHRLSPFSRARHDPFRYVSYCTGCGGLVVVDVGDAEPASRRMTGYALEANCACDKRSPSHS